MKKKELELGAEYSCSVKETKKKTKADLPEVYDERAVKCRNEVWP